MTFQRGDRVWYWQRTRGHTWSKRIIGTVYDASPEFARIRRDDGNLNVSVEQKRLHSTAELPPIKNTRSQKTMEPQKVQFKITLKLGPEVLATVEGRERPADQLTVADVQEHLIETEQFLEHLLGLRVHLESV